MLWVLTSTRGHFTSLCHQTDIQDGQSEISSCRSGSGVTGHYACADELATAKLKRQSDLVSGFHRYQQKKGYKKMCICQTPIAIPKKGNVEMHFWTVHKKCNTDFPPKKRAEADTEASLRVSHSIKREDAGMNIAVAKQFFFLLEKDSQVVLTSSGVVLLIWSLHIWTVGSMDSPFSAGQLLALPISC